MNHLSGCNLGKRYKANNSSVFRLTPAHRFHAYPTTAGSFLYYADLKRGDLFRIDIPTLFERL